MTYDPSFAGIQIPKAVRVKGSAIAWEFDMEHPEYRRARDQTVADFANLADARASAICDYALRNGVLEALTVKLPFGTAERLDDWRRFTLHNDRDAFLRLKAPGGRFVTLADGTSWTVGEAGAVLFDRTEPIELWRSLARRLRAVLRIDAALKARSKPIPPIGTPEDWQALRSTPPSDVANAQWVFGDEVNWWLAAGFVRPYLAVATPWADTKSEWRFEMRYQGLIGGIAYQLLTTVIGEKRIFVCDGCRLPYVRVKRAPQPDQENFCPNCGDVARKRAIQRHRAAKKGAAQ